PGREGLRQGAPRLRIELRRQLRRDRIGALDEELDDRRGDDPGGIGRVRGGGGRNADGGATEREQREHRYPSYRHGIHSNLGLSNSLPSHTAVASSLQSPDVEQLRAWLARGLRTRPGASSSVRQRTAGRVRMSRTQLAPGRAPTVQ